MKQSFPFVVRDLHLVVETAETVELKEQVYSHGNRRLQDLSRRRRERGGPAGAGPLPSFDADGLVERWLEQLDEAGVAQGVVLAEAPTARDPVAAVAARSKERLAAFTSLDPVQTWSAEDLGRDVARGFSGLNLMPTLQHFHLWDRRTYPLFEVAERLRVPVMVHFGQTASVFADLRYANPLDLQPVARDFPDVPFVVAGLGRGFLRELLLVMDNCPNVATDTSGDHAWLSLEPARLGLDDALRLVLDTGGPARLLFATGSGACATRYRRDLLVTQLELAERLGLAERDQALFFGGNLERLLGEIDRDAATAQPQRLLRLRTGARGGDDGK